MKESFVNIIFFLTKERKEEYDNELKKKKYK